MPEPGVSLQTSALTRLLLKNKSLSSLFWKKTIETDDRATQYSFLTILVIQLSAINAVPKPVIVAIDRIFAIFAAIDP